MPRFFYGREAHVLPEFPLVIATGCPYMPIYEYRCESCGHELEALQKISDAPLEMCPACENASLKKRVSAAAFRLKGGGWYETDFKSGKKKNLAGEAKDSTATDSKGKGAEKKPAAESSPKSA